MPDSIIDNLKPIIILVIVAVAVLRKVMEGINANKPSPPGPTLEEIFGPDSEPREPDYRRIPTVPPPLRQAATPPPLHRGSAAVPQTRMDTELARQHEIQERVRKIREAKLKAQAASPLLKLPPTAHREASISHSLNLRLHNRKELRRAFILKEILDRPISLR